MAVRGWKELLEVWAGLESIPEDQKRSEVYSRVLAGVRVPSQRVERGWESPKEGQKGLGGLPRGPGGVEKPSQKAGRG